MNRFPADETSKARATDEGALRDERGGPDAAAPKRAWQQPTIVAYGQVKLVTKGISYRPLDGISNLS